MSAQVTERLHHLLLDLKSLIATIMFDNYLSAIAMFSTIMIDLKTAEHNMMVDS